ncbi:hypothetical protein RND71_029899 [Anisodus tanguticus]|uniref:Uncharacterized protein n=1 Tax=Anisodus tanguticus TaxID=243964 RepID=A0AAE1RGD7_9SOLA|nr:hypothetical protein RND71_029899 [Anisodus tanguticus]
MLDPNCSLEPFLFRNRGKQTRSSIIEASWLRQIQEINSDRRLKLRAGSPVRRSLDGVSSDKHVVAPVRGVREAHETIVVKLLFLHSVDEKKFQLYTQLRNLNLDNNSTINTDNLGKAVVVTAVKSGSAVEQKHQNTKKSRAKYR